MSGISLFPVFLNGLAGQGLRRVLARRAVRVACGLAILAFGILGLLRAGGGPSPGWLDVLCLTPGGPA